MRGFKHGGKVNVSGHLEFTVFTQVPIKVRKWLACTVV